MCTINHTVVKRLALILLLSLNLPITAHASVSALSYDKGILCSVDALKLLIVPVVWGPEKWVGLRGETSGKKSVSRTTFAGVIKENDSGLTIDVDTEQTAPDQLTLNYSISSEKDANLRLAAIKIDPDSSWQGRVRTTSADKQVRERNWPIGKADLGDKIKKLEFISQGKNLATIAFTPPANIYADNELRVELARELKSKQAKSLDVRITFPEEVSFYPAPSALLQTSDKKQWFPWKPKYSYKKNNIIVMDSWAESPAGSDGRISRDGSELVYNQTPIKLWGLNVTYAACAPSKILADRRADFYAKHGVNAVRLHKYAEGSGWAGILADDSATRFSFEQLDRMDYFIAALKKRGIFVLLSPLFGSTKLGLEDYEQIEYAHEWGAKPAMGKRLKTGSGAIYLSRELQDLQIAQMKNLLNHKNPYTGLKYAQDPAIAFVELVNEESALFFGTLKQLKNSPTLRGRTAAHFTDWILSRYGGKDQVLEHWGRNSIGAFERQGFGSESFADKSIAPVGNPWFWDPKNLNSSQKELRPRLLDTALFLSELQNEFYDRYEKALRSIGYQGEIISSNWQAGRGVSHYYNMHSDQRYGMIDRHNYFTGNGSMLSMPGGGMLSTGMQQVADRPFGLSEWIHVFPNQWGAEGPAIIGAYGMGLQDWDASFIFQNKDDGKYSSELGGHRWDVTVPQVFALFPAISRQVRRNDVKTSSFNVPLNVNHDSLIFGKIGFKDKVEQRGDYKIFSTDKVPAETLAIARVTVRFTDKDDVTPQFDITPYIKKNTIRSSTGQLHWYRSDSDEGYFAIDSEATKAVVGFAQGKTIDLHGVSITSYSPFSAIYLTAHSETKTISTDNRLLLVAVARAHNTDMKYFNAELVDRGAGPIKMEPVVADIHLEKGENVTVYACDHDGNRTRVTIPVVNGTFKIDGTQTKTVYYEIVYD